MLSVRDFARPIDTSWRRTSYTAITEGAHLAATATATAATSNPGTSPVPVGSAVGSEPETEFLADEPPTVSPLFQANFEPGVPLPLADVAGGALFGTLVHAVLERTDFAADDIDTELARHLAVLAPRIAPTLARPDVLAATLVPALRGVLQTPLGPRLEEICLRDLSRRDRLDEVAFDLPLAGRASELTVGALATLIAGWLSADDPLAGYPEHLARLDAGEALRGYLTGSIDLVMRLHGDSTKPDRYVVIDYKTNRLAPRGATLQSSHYRPAAMAAAMRDAHYPLQALLYCVALHRYLRGRQAGYDPEAHLGGVAYLFLRGMTGPATPRVEGQPCGVFRWKAPDGLIVELSDLLERGAP
jgi:exodeoxyribonuclease V beta subunit